MKYLFDTSVITELIANEPNPNVITYVDSLDQEDVFLSAISVGEIAKGIQLLPNSARKDQLQTWLREDLMRRFEGRILALDAELFLHWGELTARLELLGVPPIPSMDSLIAATALTHHLVLVTMNEDDYDGSGLEIVNPW